MRLWDVLLGTLRGPRPKPPPAPRPVPSTAGLVDALNAERVKRDVGLLRETAAVSEFAQSWADDMALHGDLTHGAFSGRILHAFPGRAGAEDIAEGEVSVTDVVRDWMNSPPHRANILNPAYSVAGVGEALDKNGVPFWTVDFLA